VSLPLERGETNAFRFSNTLTEDWFIQITAERRELKYKKGRPEVAFVRIGRRAAEALDCVVYAIAAKQLCRFEYESRYEALKGRPVEKPSLKSLAARLHG